MKSKILLNEQDAAYFSTHFLVKGKEYPLSDSFMHWSRENKESLVKDLCGGDRSMERNQNLLQILLLYDEILFPYGVLDNVDISAIKNYFKVTIIESESFNKEYSFNYSFEDCFERKEDDFFVEYIKPSIINYLVKSLGEKYYKIKGELSCEEFMSRMIDFAFGKKMYGDDNFFYTMSKNIDMFVSREFNPIYIDYPKNEIERVGSYLSELFLEIQNVFYRVLWEIKQSNDNDCLIYNSYYDIQNLGLKEDYQVERELNLYKNIRVNINDKICQLPEMINFEELLRVKEKHKKDIKRLREVLSELECDCCNKNTTISKRIINDLDKAVKELNWAEKLSSFSNMATYLSVPIGVAETILDIFPALGISVGVLGVSTTVATKYFVNKNNWVNAVR